MLINRDLFSSNFKINKGYLSKFTCQILYSTISIYFRRGTSFFYLISTPPPSFSSLYIKKFAPFSVDRSNFTFLFRRRSPPIATIAALYDPLMFLRFDGERSFSFLYLAVSFSTCAECDRFSGVFLIDLLMIKKFFWT